MFPELACAEDLEQKRIASVLDRSIVDVGSAWLVHAARRFLAARVKAFVGLARRRLADPRRECCSFPRG